jgi:hypothetical protein
VQDIAVIERDGHRYSMNRKAMVELLMQIITSPPESATLDNPLCEVRYVGKASIMAAAFPDKTRCMELLTKLLGWAEPTLEFFKGGWGATRSTRSPPSPSNTGHMRKIGGEQADIGTGNALSV